MCYLFAQSTNAKKKLWSKVLVSMWCSLTYHWVSDQCDKNDHNKEDAWNRDNHKLPQSPLKYHKTALIKPPYEYFSKSSDFAHIYVESLNGFDTFHHFLEEIELFKIPRSQFSTSCQKELWASPMDHPSPQPMSRRKIFIFSRSEVENCVCGI